MTKNDLANLLKCLEIVQGMGKIEPAAMLTMGVTYTNATNDLSKMNDGDVLIVFTPEAAKKNEVPAESGEQSPNEAE